MNHQKSFSNKAFQIISLNQERQITYNVHFRGDLQMENSKHYKLTIPDVNPTFDKLRGEPSPFDEKEKNYHKELAK